MKRRFVFTLPRSTRNRPRARWIYQGYMSYQGDDGRTYYIHVFENTGTGQDVNVTTTSSSMPSMYGSTSGAS